MSLKLDQISDHLKPEQECIQYQVPKEIGHHCKDQNPLLRIRKNSRHVAYKHYDLEKQLGQYYYVWMKCGLVLGPFPQIELMAKLENYHHRSGYC